MRVAVLVVFLLGLNSPTVHSEPKEIRLPTAADGEVVFQMDPDTRLPLSAFDEQAEVTKAALTFLPKEPNKPLHFTWQYELRFKTGSKVKSVTVEDERDAALRTLIDDRNPTVTQSSWTGQEESHEVTQGVVKAMFEKNPWVLLRRITVEYEDGKQSKLHQMVVMTQPMRMNLVEKTMQALKANQ